MRPAQPLPQPKTVSSHLTYRAFIGPVQGRLRPSPKSSDPDAIAAKQPFCRRGMVWPRAEALARAPKYGIVPTVRSVKCIREDRMGGAFVLAQHAESNRPDWGKVTWVCHPASVGASKLAIVCGDLLPDKGHNFHKHPRQEEVIFVVSGLIEQSKRRSSFSDPATRPSSLRTPSMPRLTSAMRKRRFWRYSVRPSGTVSRRLTSPLKPRGTQREADRPGNTTDLTKSMTSVDL
jgi:hypothetical protein